MSRESSEGMTPDTPHGTEALALLNKTPYRNRQLPLRME